MRWKVIFVSIGVLLMVPVVAMCQVLTLRTDGVEFPDATVQTTAAVDTLADLSCGAGQVAKWSGSAWLCADDVTGGGAYSRTAVVGPVGTPTENGTALLAALAGIPTPAAHADAWLLKLEPGEYDVGTTPFAMKQWVDVEGSGEGVTTITGAVCGQDTGVVVGAAETELRMLSVESTCATVGTAIGVYSVGDRTRLWRVGVSMGYAGVLNRGIWMEGTGAVIEDVVVDITAGSINTAVWTLGDGSSVSGASLDVSGTAGCKGVHVAGSSSTVRGIDASISGGVNTSSGVYVDQATDCSLRDVVATVTASQGAEGISVVQGSVAVADTYVEGKTGMNVDNSGTNSVTLTNVTVVGSSSYGLLVDENTGDLTVSVDHSRISGPTASVYNYGSGATVRIGASQLGGGGVIGTATCALVYDESYSYSLDTCP